MEISLLVSTLADAAFVVLSGILLAAVGLWFFDSHGRKEPVETGIEERERRAA